MAIQSDKLDFSQPENALSKIAEEQRKKLFPRNDFKPTDQSSPVHPDAIAKGDKIGRGTGGDLDVYNQMAGTSQDITERKEDLKINKFSSNNPYYTVT
jgi:muramoyltetrapeptide carboxypeptidase LdcA involved in peptidoglycan recycling